MPTETTERMPFAESEKPEAANMTALTFLAIWILISIPFGILVGRCFNFHRRDEPSQRSRPRATAATFAPDVADPLVGDRRVNNLESTIQN